MIAEDTYEDNEESEDSGEDVYKSMVEAQLINFVLDNGSYDIIKHNGIDESYFPGYRDEFMFIQNHYMRYKAIPDVPTFLDKFEDFDLFEVFESEKYMVDKIKEEKAYAMVLPVLNIVNEAAARDAIEAVKLMRDKADTILKTINIVKFGTGYDIFKMGSDRYDEYIRKLNLGGDVGFLTGVPGWDSKTNGWANTDFGAIVGRPQEGKSWVLEYCLLQPWRLQQKKVLLFSLENPKEIVGYRADTLLRHFSNRALTWGKDVLRWENQLPTMVPSDYAKYIDEIKNYDIPFIVLDNSDSPDGGWSIEDIWEMTELLQPDIVGVDQLSLMVVRERVKNIREGYVHTTRTARKFVNHFKKPLLMNSQAGRDTSKMQMKNREEAPELHQIAESDSVGQDATKVMTIRNLDGILKWHCRKNTLGPSEFHVSMRWDIDLGIIEPITLEMADGSPDPSRIF